MSSGWASGGCATRDAPGASRVGTSVRAHLRMLPHLLDAVLRVKVDTAQRLDEGDVDLLPHPRFLVRCVDERQVPDRVGAAAALIRGRARPLGAATFVRTLRQRQAEPPMPSMMSRTRT